MNWRGVLIAAPGLHGATGRGWLDGIEAAFSVAIADPVLWLWGAVGFVARGGLLALALPIFTIPSDVLVSILLRDEITTSGVSPRFIMLGTIVAVGCGLAVLGALLLSAYADLAVFERTVRDPETEDLRARRPARELRGAERRNLLLRVAAVKALGLLPIMAVGAALIGSRIEGVVVGELRFPSALDAPLAIRVLGDLRQELLWLAAVILVVDVVVTLAERRMVAARVGLLPEASPPGTEPPRDVGDLRAAAIGAFRLVRQPIRVLATATLVWVVTIVTLAPMLWATLMAWGAVRGTLLTGEGADPDRMLAVAVTVAVFAAIWITAVVLAGVTSAVRAALWNTDSLR